MDHYEEDGRAVEHLLTTGHLSALCEQARRDLGPQPAGAEPWGWGPPGMLVATAPARAGEGPRR